MEGRCYGVSIITRVAKTAKHAGMQHYVRRLANLCYSAGCSFH